MVLLRRALVKSHTLDTAATRSLSVLMQVETLGEALTAGWRVHARCLDGAVEYTRSKAKCHHQAELNLETLVRTRGRNMPLSGMRDRMMCPRCGNRRVNLIFEPPSVAKRAPIA
jgi:hypothetical protein